MPETSDIPVLNVRIIYKCSPDGRPVLRETDPVNQVTVVDPRQTIASQLTLLFQAFGAPADTYKSYTIRAVQLNPGGGQMKTKDIPADTNLHEVLSFSDTVLLCRKGG